MTNPRSSTNGQQFILSTLPSAPTAVNVTRTTNVVKVQWTAASNPTNPITSYSVKFKKSDNSFAYISGQCSVTTPCSTTPCSCEVLMTTLTTSTGWTSADDKYIEVEVYSHNSDGASVTPATLGTPATDSVKYMFAPLIAPAISALTSSTTQIDVTITCLSDLDAG